MVTSTCQCISMNCLRADGRAEQIPYCDCHGRMCDECACSTNECVNYIGKLNVDKCSSCGSEFVVYEELRNADDYTVKRRVNCSECGEHWFEVYRLNKIVKG